MFLLDDTVVTSASDLTAASNCEFAFLRTLDAKLGRIDRVATVPDAMYERTSRLGDEHEHRVLERYREQFGEGTVEIPRPERMSRAALDAVASDTDRAFAAGANVVFQATFFDDGGTNVCASNDAIAFIGFADFIVRQPDGSYLVQDTKLARHARVTALLQLAAYAEQLERIGVQAAPTVQLLLGDGSVSEHRLSDITPVFHKRRTRLHRIIAERLADPNNAAVAWGDSRYAVCGQCDACEAEIQRTRDVLLVAGMRVTQRALLATAGIRTIDELAASAGSIDGIADKTLAGLRAQAALQTQAQPDAPPPLDIYNPAALAALPHPDAGDIFFDFEGDPLYTEGEISASAVGAAAGGSTAGAPTRWGLDYLFGLVETDERFRAFWAHDFEQEKTALRGFLDFLGERRRQHPGMHVYHYAAYERTHLLSLAARHGIGEDEVDGLLRDNVLVDLYPLVRNSFRVGSRSYSIKKLEPLYMGAELREGDVTNAADSITEYAQARELDAVGDTEAGQRMLDSIADYNRYDCVSTLRLRDWMLRHAAERGIRIGDGRSIEPPDDLEPSPLRDGLLALAARGEITGGAVGGHTAASGRRTADQTAAAFAAAAIDYHRREQKSFWWAHYARLIDPIEEWEDTRDVFVVEQATLERDWFREGRQRRNRRHLRLRGRLAPGSSIQPGDQAGPFLLYEYPGPFAVPGAEPGARTAREVTVLEMGDDGSFLIEELQPQDVEPYDALPSALTPAKPPPAGAQKPAIDEWAQTILDAQPGWPADPMTDILRRVPPRTQSGTLAEAASLEDRIAAVTASALELDQSYLAVQGPPGTGKTYLGAHAIAALVRDHRWKIGVVAQSHRVVETLLTAVVAAGLPAELVGKVPQRGSGTSSHTFTTLPQNGQLLFAVDNATTGFVVGGTAWDFSNPARVERHSLDLLVIDEAGQFSLASTIAASASANNLLLLGDPQQLPQVSQGTHPEPVDQSALGWVSAGHDVLPPNLGYFLAETRRMHPALTAPVSRLSYEGRLRAHPVASTRELAGVAPGLHVVPVEHEGNATSSPEEAQVVVETVRSVLGSGWSDPTEGRSGEPLTEADLIVVTPYNAQLWCVRDALAAAGFHDIRVGTVDKFQGQEAVVAIVTLAASAAVDVPRGLGFLIMKNRLNVAISRAQWAAYLIYSPHLTEALPVTPDAVAELSAFITLVEQPESVAVAS
ncbi:TM0106 family RecB-like putative nuclease [Rathayibacter soli]|uniref:TM0106 family RecB-like putative nuclease n=1 Tax=Rathayibacter soli TaxID=3144168 RepID=UPI0027E487B6|nr:TM0106 family RecB-like putative nuclease [Glaciibacter superstes]